MQKDRIHGRTNSLKRKKGRITGWEGGGRRNGDALPLYSAVSDPRRPAPRSRTRPLEQPQRFGLLPIRPSLGGPGLRRPLLAVGPASGRGSGSDVSRVLRFVLPLGSRPFGHRQDHLGQRGQVLVIERLDVRVGRGLLYPNGGPAPLMDTTTFSSSGGRQKPSLGSAYRQKSLN